jgi:hypothetical protein
MEGGCTNLTDVTRSTELLKINGYCMAKTMDSDDGPIKSRWNVHGYDWEVHLYPAGLSGRRVSSPSLALKLIFVGEARTGSVRACLCCRLVDPRGKLKPSEEKIEAVSSNPHSRSDRIEAERERELEVDDEHLVVFGAAYNLPLFCLLHPLIERLQSKAVTSATFPTESCHPTTRNELHDDPTNMEVLVLNTTQSS